MRPFRTTNCQKNNPVAHGPPPWRRDLRRLAWARGISMAGAGAGYIAMLALAWRLTGSASDASLVLFASVIAGTIGSPVAGWIGDRFDRRSVVVISELVIAASLVAMACATSMWHLLAASACTTLAAVALGAALDAALPNLVPPSELARANATLAMARTIGHVVGPLLGGMLVGLFGPRVVFLLDAGSSLVGAALLVGIAGATCAPGRHADTRAVDETASGGEPSSALFAGFGALGADRGIMCLLAGSAALGVCFAFVTAAELPLAVQFGYDEAGLGAIASCWCAGALIGSWRARRTNAAQRGARVLIVNALIATLVFVGAGLAPTFPAVLVLMAIGGASMSAAAVVESTLLQQRIADDVRARTMAAYRGVLSALWATNLALGGLLVELTSPGTTYVYAGAWCVVAAAGFAVLARQLRRELVARDLLAARPRHALETDLATGA